MSHTENLGPLRTSKSLLGQTMGLARSSRQRSCVHLGRASAQDLGHVSRTSVEGCHGKWTFDSSNWSTVQLPSVRARGGQFGQESLFIPPSEIPHFQDAGLMRRRFTRLDLHHLIFVDVWNEHELRLARDILRTGNMLKDDIKAFVRWLS